MDEKPRSVGTPEIDEAAALHEPENAETQGSSRIRLKEAKERDGVRASIIGALAVLAAALVGGLSAWIVGTIQADSQARESRASFLREQRIAIYSRVLSDSQTLYQQSVNYKNDFYKEVVDLRGELPSALDLQFKQMIDQYRETQVDVAEASLIGSPATGEASERILDVLSSVTFVVDKYVPPLLGEDGAENTLVGLHAELDAAVENFKVVAKADLDI